MQSVRSYGCPLGNSVEAVQNRFLTVFDSGLLDETSAKGKDAISGVLEHPLDATNSERHLQPEFDLCQQCTRRRERARILQQQRKRSDYQVSLCLWPQLTLLEFRRLHLIVEGCI